MKTVLLLTGRNIRIYFKDKVTFFTSLITPVILLILYVTFLRSVYVDSLLAGMPEGIEIPEKLINGFTGGWLVSSILGVSAVTVAFSSNNIMAMDRVTKRINDFYVTPVKRGQMAVAYYFANFFTTLLVCLIALCVSLLFLGKTGWYLTFRDIPYILLDVLGCVFFGTSLAAFVEQFVSTQGGISAVSTAVSSMYGFICGAYMPISQFAGSIQKFVSFVPGTYGTVLLRNHFMHGAIAELTKDLPAEMTEELRRAFDNTIFFFNNEVSVGAQYAVLFGSSAVILLLYVLTSNLRKKKG